MHEDEQLSLPRAKPVTVLPPEDASPTAGLFAGISTGRKLAALAVAAASDAISLATAWAPPVQWMIDVTTALILFALLGFRWALLPALVVEAVPGLAMFPTWLVSVAVLVGVTPTRT